MQRQHSIPLRTLLVVLLSSSFGCQDGTLGDGKAGQAAARDAGLEQDTAGSSNLLEAEAGRTRPDVRPNDDRPDQGSIEDGGEAQDSGHTSTTRDGQTDLAAADQGTAPDRGLVFEPDAAPASSTIEARARVVGETTCVAPCAVFFDATETQYSGHSEDDKFLGLEYSWDFGDPDSGFWQEGARARGNRPPSRNHEFGFVAVHVYERPGSYRVSLRVSDAEGSDALDMPLLLTIRDPTEQWPGSQTVCIASSSLPVAGSDGCPLGAAVFQDSDFNRSVELHCRLHSASTRCLFRGGDRFSSNTRSRIGNPGPAMIGSYGNGRARIDATGSRVLQPEHGSTGLRVVDLQFVGSLLPDSAFVRIEGGSTSTADSGSAISRFLALRLQIENFDSGLHLRGSSYPANDPIRRMHSEIAIVDSSVLRGAGEGGNDVFIMGNYYAILGTRVSDKRNGGGGEHTLRSKYARRSVIAHSAFGLLEDNPEYYGCQSRGGAAQGNLVLKMVSGFSPSLAAVGRSSDGHSREYIIADNYISSCRDNAWNLTVAPTDNTAAKAPEHHRRFVIEGNHFVGHLRQRQSGSGQHLRLSNASHYVVRNNIFDLSGPAMSMTAIAVSDPADQQGLPGHLQPVGGRILNNTCFDDTPNDESRRFLYIDSGQVADLQVENNLVYDTDGQTVFVSTRNGGRATCCGGSCPNSCNLVAENSPFAEAISFPSQLQQLRPRGDADQVRNSGRDQSGRVTRDVAGVRRPIGDGWDIGAWESP